MHPEWNWTVLSLCRIRDKDRAPKFKKVCKKLGAKCAMSDLEDEYPERKLKSLDEVKERVRAMMKQLKLENEFDYVFTHGANGEYGHNRHKEVNRTVHAMIKDGELHAKKVFFFCYKKAHDGFYCVANERDADANTRLNAQIAQSKHLLISLEYQFSNGSFEERSTRAIESFKVKQYEINGTLSLPAGT